MNREYWLGLIKDWGIALAIVAGVVAVWAVLFSPTPQSSGPAPDFTLTTPQGESVTLSESQADAVVVNFWFTTCPPCRKEIPELARFHEAHPEVPMYGISVDQGMPDAELSKRARKLGINYPILRDADMAVAQTYGVSLFPTTFIIHEGQIAWMQMGEVTNASLEGALKSLHH